MKLLAILLLAAVALATPDGSYQTYQDPYYQSYQDTAASSNYYQTRPRPASPVISDVFSKIFSPVRRQGFDIESFGIAPIILLALLFILGFAAMAGVFFMLSLTSSGRGLDTDEWEVDHSVWMDQLQRDFENSWSTQ